MPIKPENKHLYPDDWREISRRIRHERARGRCECRGECGSDHTGGVPGPDWSRCDAPNGETIYRDIETPHVWYSQLGPLEEDEARAVKVVLTVAHLDHDPTNNDPGNLRAMCQLCHLRYDREHHAQTRARTRLAAQPVLPFEVEP